MSRSRLAGFLSLAPNGRSHAVFAAIAMIEEKRAPCVQALPHKDNLAAVSFPSSSVKSMSSRLVRLYRIVITQITSTFSRTRARSADHTSRRV